MNIRSINAAYGAKPLNSIAKTEKKQAPERTSLPQGEQVELSDTSLSMNKLKDIIDNTPDVRIKLVEEIKTKIKYNSYPLESNFYKALESMVNDKTLI